MPMLTDTITRCLKRIRRLGCCVIPAVCMAARIAGAADPAETPPQTNEDAKVVAKTAESLEQKWGIQVSGLFLSSGGNMVDFRYKVLDPVKAAFLTKPETKPELLSQTSGAKLLVPNTPKVGQLRQITRQPVAGKMYFILFANTRHHVKSGDKVTIAAGAFKMEGLTVE